jgi:hypothetical protein
VIGGLWRYVPNPLYIFLLDSGLRRNDGDGGIPPISPSAAPSSTAKTGDFGNHLFELRNRPRFMWPVRASLIAARLGEQRRGFRRNAAGGAFFFGFFLLGKQKKEACRRATPGIIPSGETD